MTQYWYLRQNGILTELHALERSGSLAVTSTGVIGLQGGRRGVYNTHEVEHLEPDHRHRAGDTEMEKDRVEEGGKKKNPLLPLPRSGPPRVSPLLSSSLLFFSSKKNHGRVLGKWVAVGLPLGRVLSLCQTYLLSI